MSDKETNNNKNDIKQNTSNVNVSGNITNSAGVIIGSNIHVAGGINVTNVIQEIRSYGLKYLSPDYFRVNLRSSYQGFDKWKNGFPFKLQDIMHGHHFQRTDLLNDIINKLEDNNGNHALLLLGKSGTSKSIVLMDIMCHYFKNNFVVFYNFGEEEIKNLYDLENSLKSRLKDGNKILVAVDNVNDKKTAAIFSIIDSLRSYEKRDNIRFILTGRQPEFDRFVDDRLDTVLEPVRQSIQNIYYQISYHIPNFTPKEIENFLKRYKDEDDIKRFVNNNNFDYNKLFIDNDLVTLNNVSSFIYEKTKGDPILLKFFIFGKGFGADVKYRFFNYIKSSEIKLQSMLVCAILDRAEIAISYDLIEKMNLVESLFELTDETLTFLENENRWRTIHPKWDLELLAYLYNVKDYATLEKRKEILRKSLESLINNLTNEHDKLSILGSLYDSTTTDTEENRKFPIKIIESIVTNKNNLIYNSLSEHSRYDLYSYYISKNYYYSNLFKKCLDANEEALKIYPNGINALVHKGIALNSLGQYEEAIKCYDEVINKLDPTSVLAWLHKGVTLVKLGKTEEAIECFDEIITKLDPKYVHAWGDKGWALDKLSRYQEAIECYDKALEIDSNDKNVLDSKGYTLLNLGKYEAAIECFNKALSIDPGFVDAIEHKKIAEEKLRNRNK
jgi:tetratricopeptide (TPR) repeat protein